MTSFINILLLIILDLVFIFVFLADIAQFIKKKRGEIENQS